MYVSGYFKNFVHGPHHKQVDGTVLVADRNSGYAPLERFGTAFLERLQQVQLSSPLLKALTLVDTPGIIENRKQRERGYRVFSMYITAIFDYERNQFKKRG